ncbi:MAG TPA: NADH-quinone oxidoreductase subunit N [Actinophytocola sp.]|uniref:NADH-quinone oxidoreductase subunit N n=1 Tax=Actinophytocola sp. TaxID=1872138 RepID=UPI002DBDBC41|nr:NADH-quinone oxidoreductase subunit N [Actinophytocola sp.]HEU5471874.1 NADH-quinone oxidoreductase subunit N [Actinophytocola sp.]
MPPEQSIDYLATGPPLVLIAGALAVLVADAFRPRSGLAAGGALTAVLVALGVEAVLAANAPLATFCVGASCSYAVDSFTVLFQVVLLLAGLVVLLLARVEIRQTRLPAGEFHFLLLAALAGALTLAAGRDLVILVVGLEVVSLPLFALVALRRYDGRSTEAGLKMFLVSVTSTAVMLFGISLVYGATGTMFLDAIGAALRRPDTPGAVAAAGMVLVLVGFGFKISAVPFHFWTPDTYQGAPVTVAAFLSVVSKAAGFAGLILVLTVAFGPLVAVWGPLVAVLAAVTMTLGNLVALRQRTVMRLLAWSSIAQAGYMLAPLGMAAGVAGTRVPELVAATVGYLAIYAAMSLGVFAVVSYAGWIGGRGGGEVDDYRGLAGSHPVTALALAFFLACLAGLPPGLAGLFAKIVVFRGVLTGGFGALAVLMVVNTVIGLYYYLAWASRLFARTGSSVHFGRMPRPVVAAVLLSGVATVLMSVLPQLVLGIAPAGG